MVKSSVKVAIRTRPTANFASKNLKLDLEKKTIEVFIAKDNSQGLINNQQENWKFKFDSFLHNSTQEEVFETCGHEIVRNVIEGYNGTIMAYGQTGAGKTYTMSGGSQNYKFRGVIPRAVSQVFNEISSKPELSFIVKVSFVEIYNELIYDLLSSVAPADQTGNIMIQDDLKFGIVVKGLTLVTCNNEEEALNHLFEGETNRTVAEHKLNKSSTRSHCIYTIHLESRSRVESSEKVIFSKLNLVDLAGSERIKKTGSEGLTLTEANFINKSLSYMEQVVIALSEKGREHVPYRQSKLTYLLKDSLGGNSKTLMIANIWPEPDHLEETISTLRFATRMMRVSNEATINIELDPLQLIERYKKEARDLKQELAMHDTLANRSRVVYENYTPEQQYQMQLIAEKYLDGAIEEIDFESLRQIKEILFQMRNIFKKNVGRYSGGLEKGKTRPPTSKTGPIKSDLKGNEDKEDGVGQEEHSGGFGLGKANPNSRPVDSSALEPKSQFKQEEDEHHYEKNKSILSMNSEEAKKVGSAKSMKRETQPDKNSGFNEFKQTEGHELDQSLSQLKEDLREKSAELKSIASEVNNIKKEIDITNQTLENARKHRATEEEDIIDEEEFVYIKKLRDLKKQYRIKFDYIKGVKDEVANLNRDIEFLREKMVAEFERWYENKYRYLPVVREENRTDPKLAQEKSTEDLDQDALAYIKAKKNVQTLHKAKKTLGAIGKA